MGGLFVVDVGEGAGLVGGGDGDVALLSTKGQ
jgi:hypothetical protein